MMDLSFLLPLLYAGAGIVGTTAVQESTKAAFLSLKTKVIEIFGTRASKPLAALEANPVQQDAREDLAAVLSNIKPDEQTELEPLVKALLAAFKSDPAARTAAMERGAVRLDLNAGGNIVVERIKGASLLDVKADAKGDLTVSDIAIKGQNDSGN